MKRKILILFVLTISVITLSGCKSNKDALNFKNDYEEINGKENASGKIHRTISISKNNKFVEVTPEEILKKLENKETFYVYFGSRLCPWCRSVIEKADEISRNKKIDKIYYVDIWDDEGSEILRDKYTLNENNELELISEGTKTYKNLLTLFDNVLSDYNLTDSEGNSISTNEKRIYAPNFIYVENGKAIRMVEGQSSKQTDSREELTTEMLKDEEEIFNKFFK